MTSGKKLIFFTRSYPYGFGELWKTNELKVLKEYFDQILIVPFEFGGNMISVAPIDGITYTRPLFECQISYPAWYHRLIAIIISPNREIFFCEFFREKVFFSLTKIKAWLLYSYRLLAIKKNLSFKKIIDEVDRNTILYFYWGRWTSEVLPVLKLTAPCFKIVCRFHRYDLYRYANSGYIPYQYYQIVKLDYALPCSEDGKNELISYYPKFKDKIIVSRLGTLSSGRATRSEDGVLRIVSCSLIEKVKRIDLIAHALPLLNVQKIEWTHIGGGSKAEDISSIALRYDHERIRFRFLGQIPNQMVIDYYSNNTIDLFINVSESEGVPVSVMEALAAGIPVIATDVGGTREIIDCNVGSLINKNISHTQLAEFIFEFYNLSDDQKNTKRENAYETYLDKCEAVIHAKKLATLLISA
ncbi:MAG TPA: glycosyltransferase [Chitinophagaceae bacterium]|nr:glycosyltransferase [Chitinophagaceae bacterium]